MPSTQGYSVSASFASRRVSPHVFPEQLIVVAEGQAVCTLARIIERSHHKPGKVIYNWQHSLPLVHCPRTNGGQGLAPTQTRGVTKWHAVQRDATSRHHFLRKRACRAMDAFRRLRDHMLRKEGGDREMVDILSLVLHHDEDAVLCGMEIALDGGVPPKTHVLNLLHRLIDRKQTDLPEVGPQDALSLDTAPKANVDRYDDLRQTGEKRFAPKARAS